MLRESKRRLNQPRRTAEVEVITGFTDRGDPVVSLSPRCGRSGTRSFDDPYDLARLSAELRLAIHWLMRQKGGVR